MHPTLDQRDAAPLWKPKSEDGFIPTASSGTFFGSFVKAPNIEAYMHEQPSFSFVAVRRISSDVRRFQIACAYQQIKIRSGKMIPHTKMSQIGFFLFCSLVLIIISMSQTLSGRESLSVQDDKQAVQSLLNEVHQLRIAIQTANLVGYKSQVIVGRLRSQQDRVNELRLSIEHIHEEISNTTANRARMQERLKDLESQISGEKDTAKVAQLKDEYKDLKYNLEQQESEETKLREKESQLMTQLQTEQLKLDEFNEKLDAIERQLELQESSDNPKRNQKLPK